MKSYSPGPWSLPHFAWKQLGCNCGFVFAGKAAQSVCEVYYQSTEDKIGSFPRIEEAKANAHLISAAPDMYEAIKATIEMDAEEGYLLHPDIIKMLLDAMHKAEGREPEEHEP